MKTARRDFFKKALFGAGAAVATLGLPQVVLGQRRPRGGDAAKAELKLVTPGQGMAASVNYVHKASDIKDSKIMLDRQGVKFKDQNCTNCILYTKHGMQGGEEVGKCQLFANELVKGSGWCTSWAKKA